MALQTTTLDNFPLTWRWTDPQYCVLSAEELSRIEPLTERSARKVWEKSLSFVSTKPDHLPNREMFADIDEIRCHGGADVNEWLTKRMPSGKVIVSWQQDLAAIVDAELFITHWDDFCYPASDDVSVWPFDESWVIHYWHEEVFCYGKRK